MRKISEALDAGSVVHALEMIEFAYEEAQKGSVEWPAFLKALELYPLMPYHGGISWKWVEQQLGESEMSSKKPIDTALDEILKTGDVDKAVSDLLEQDYSDDD